MNVVDVVLAIAFVMFICIGLTLIDTYSDWGKWL